MLKAKLLLIYSMIFSLPRSYLFIYVLFKIQSLTYTDLLKFVKVGGKKGLIGEITFVRIL